MTVGDVMVRRPKLLPDDVSVADVRRLLADDHVHLALVVGSGRTLVAAIERADLESGVDDVASAAAQGSLSGRTIAPATPVRDAAARMAASGRRRLAVVDEQGVLLGLLCLKRSGLGFCSDADVERRNAVVS